MKRILFLSVLLVSVGTSAMANVPKWNLKCQIDGISVNDLNKPCTYVPVKCVDLATNMDDTVIITVCIEQPKKKSAED